MMTVSPLTDSQTESLLPRRYQEEVFARAQKENIIAALSTGSGKTLISLLLIRWISALDSSKGKVIIFLVPKVALVEQQGNFIQKNTPLRVIKLYGRLDLDLTDRNQWKKRFATHDVFVMTAQIFFNSLTHSVWSIDKVSLMIFDECHHARKNHPYNGIMREYFQTPTENRPKIFGMTASPIWNPKNAMASLTTLEVNMDAKVIGVRAHVEELDEHSPKPNEIIKEYPFPPEEYEDYLFPSLWKCLQIFEKQLWADLELPWNTLEMRYYATLNNLGPYAACLFIYGELEPHMTRIHNTYIEALRSADYAAEIELPTHIEVKPLPPDFWQVQEILSDFKTFFITSYLPESPPLTISLTWCTPKIRALIDVLLSYYSQDFQGIVFVEQRQTAICLARMLPFIPELNGVIRCGALMGQGTTGDAVARQMPAGHSVTIESFRRGDLNLLIATSVAEEGLDFPACDLVVRFDSVVHMVGYVQSRGRARNKTSTFVVMMRKGDNIGKTRYKTLQTAEPEVNKVYQNRHEDLDDLLRVDEDDDVVSSADLQERERFVVASTGAVLTYNNSIQLLNHLCSLIPRDAYTPPHVPKYSGDFQCKLTLPSSIPLPPENLSFFGPTRRSKREAKRAVAFLAVKRLYELEVFDEYLLPVAHTKDGHTADPDGRGRLSIDPKQIPAMMEVVVRDPWATGPSLWIHQVRVDGRPVAALITGTRLPPVDIHWGANTVQTLPGERMIFSCAEDEQSKRSLMLEYTRHGIWYRITPRPFAPPPSFFLTPLTKDHQPDFDIMERLAARPRGSSDWSGITEKDFDDIVIMNVNELGRIVVLRAIRTDLTPMSAPPPGSRECEAETYREYFLKKWARRRKGQPYVPTDGPLIDVAIIPRYFDGRYSIDEDDINAVPVEHTVLNGSTMPRNCCLWIPLPADIRKAFEVLPVLCHRITHVYRVRSMSHELNLPAINDNLLIQALTIPGANADYSNQRMETLGDSVLELCTSVHLLNRFPHRHEGQLTILRQYVISNLYLMGRAKELGLDTYVISETQSCRKWGYVETEEKSIDPVARRVAPRSYPRRSLQDCMEALLGASFLAGGIQTALHTGTALGLSFGGAVPWSVRYSRNPVMSPVPNLFNRLEDTLGYTFHRSEILVEAITHPSFSDSCGGTSYQRLEFLGDAFLDLVVVNYLYKKYPSATSHQIALPRAKAVCSPALALLAVKLGLDKIILINRVDLTMAISSYVPVLQSLSGKEIVERGWKYDPPKVLSDVFESVMAAILVDTAYNYEKAAAVAEHAMDEILAALSPSVAMDPYSTLLQWVAAAGCARLSVVRRTKVQNGTETEGTAIMVHGVIVAGPVVGTSQSVEKFVVSDKALAALNSEGEMSLSCLCTCKSADKEKREELSDEFEDAD